MPHTKVISSCRTARDSQFREKLGHRGSKCQPFRNTSGQETPWRRRAPGCRISEALREKVRQQPGIQNPEKLSFNTEGQAVLLQTSHNRKCYKKC